MLDGILFDLAWKLINSQIVRKVFSPLKSRVFHDFLLGLCVTSKNPSQLFSFRASRVSVAMNYFANRKSEAIPP